ncbi:MAG TPA: magnesium transporter CorA family protein [Gammaproteobacteria bacterium]|nr:magnesium transporter CorA family protein [Gammaproteobacteria bacterium]
MDSIQIGQQGPPRRLEGLETLPATGMVWLDFVRDEAHDWPQVVERLTGVRIHEQHVQDSFHPTHPSFFDTTPGYEMLIFQGLSPETEDQRMVTRSTAFFLLERMLVTIHAGDSPSVQIVRQRVLDGVGRTPRQPSELMHMLLSAMVDRFLEIREPQRAVLDQQQEALLDPANPFQDWTALIAFRSNANRLMLLCEEQTDAIESWRENTVVELGRHLEVRFNDLLEHIRRVSSHAALLHHDTEAVIQLHFSAVAHRTNEVVRVLTVVSAIFLPLTLIAGIFGMNFQNMPELHTHYGYYGSLAGMLVLAVVLLGVFRWKRYI